MGDSRPGRWRLLIGVAVLVLGAGGVLVAAGRAPAPPPGFVSIKVAGTYQSPALLERAWASPGAARYARPLSSQTNPSACGPTSIANVFHSLKLPMSADQVAEHGAGCLAGVCFGGLTLGQLAVAAAEVLPPDWSVTTLHPESVEALRDELRHANDEDRRYVINFHRGPLFGTGGGHFSPIGALLEPEDLVLVLDVNAHFGPWLAPTARLFEAMDTQDSSSGQKRGLLRLERTR